MAHLIKTTHKRGFYYIKYRDASGKWRSKSTGTKLRGRA